MIRYFTIFTLLFALVVSPQVGVSQNDTQDSTSTETVNVDQNTAEGEEPPKVVDPQTDIEPEIPLVFAKWWFWVGLIIILIFIKYVVFKK